MTYAWYFESSGTIQDFGEDPWRLLDRAVRESDECSRLSELRFGTVRLDPDVCCNGRYPLPIAWIEGEWVFGSTSDCMEAAVITYASEPSPETGHEVWCWWALGKIGCAASLKEAMRAADAVLGAAIDVREVRP